MRLLLLLIIGASCSQPSAVRPGRDDAGVARRAAHEPARNATTPVSAAGVAIDAGVTSVDAGRSPIAIVDAPMAWSDRRAELTLEYRRVHSDPDAQDLAIEPRVIVLHYTGGGSAKGTRAYFDNLEIEASRRTLARGGSVNVSAHYVIERDGTIYRLQPETRFARHCIGLNHIAIGIENVGDEKRFPLTDAQVAANVALVRDLAARFPITHLLGHHEVMTYRDHAYFVERDPSYRNDKGDPGPRFMSRVRAELGDLALAGP